MSIKIENPHGQIEISAKFLANSAGYVATKCYGVVGMVQRGSKDGIAKLLKIENMDKGVKVRTNDNVISIDLHIMAEYGININTVCQSIKENVKYHIESQTQQKIKEVNVFVESVRVN